MFEFIYDRSYYRNQKLLMDLGIKYTEKDHKLYKHALKAEGIDNPMSIKGLLLTSELRKPIVGATYRAYHFHGENDYKGSLVPVRDQAVEVADKKVDAYAVAKLPLLKTHVMALGKAVNKPLEVDFTTTVCDVCVGEEVVSENTARFGFVYHQQWFMTCEGTDNMGAHYTKKALIL